MTHQFSSVAQSRPSLQPHRLQHARLPCPSPTPRACSNSCPSSRWYHPIISSSVIPFSSRLQSFPASGSFPMSQFFPSGGQTIGVSASALVLSMNIQDWFPLGLTGLISMQSKRLSWVFSNTTVQKYQFFGDQHSLIYMCKIIFSLKHFDCCTVFSFIYFVEEILISKDFFSHLYVTYFRYFWLTEGLIFQLYLNFHIL